MAVTVSRGRGITSISGGTADEQKAEADKIIKQEQATKEQARIEKNAEQTAYGSKSPDQMSFREREQANQTYLEEVKKSQPRPSSSSSPDLTSLPFEQRQAYNQATLAQAQAQQDFINKAQSYGYTRAQADEAIRTGQPLLPSQNPEVQAVAKQLKEQGYTNEEVYDALTIGKVRKPTTATTSTTETPKPGFYDPVISISEGFAERVAPGNQVVRNLFNAPASFIGKGGQIGYSSVQYPDEKYKQYKKLTSEGVPPLVAVDTLYREINKDTGAFLASPFMFGYKVVTESQERDKLVNFVLKEPGQVVGNLAFDLFTGKLLASKVATAKVSPNDVKLTQTKSVSVLSELDNQVTFRETTGQARVVAGSKSLDYDFKSFQKASPDFDNTQLIQEAGYIKNPRGGVGSYTYRGQATQTGDTTVTRGTTQSGKTVLPSITTTQPLSETSTISKTIYGQKSGVSGMQIDIVQDVAQKEGSLTSTATIDGVDVGVSVPARQTLQTGTSTLVESPAFNQAVKDTRIVPISRSAPSNIERSVTTISASPALVQIKTGATSLFRQQLEKEVSRVATPLLTLSTPTLVSSPLTETKQTSTQTTTQGLSVVNLPMQVTSTQQAREVSTFVATDLAVARQSSTAQRSGTASAVLSIFKPATATTTTQRLNLRTPFRSSAITAPEVQVKQVSFGEDSDKPKRRGFNVFVRKKGTFRQINADPLTEEGALSLGARNVKATASATFKIQETSAPAVSDTLSGSPFDLYKFARKGNLYIQKNQYRISSPGEKQEITAKGLLAQRKKNLFR